MKLVVAKALIAGVTPYSVCVHPEGRPGDIWAVFKDRAEAEVYIDARNAGQQPGESFTLTP